MIRKFAGNVVRKLRCSLSRHVKQLRRRALLAEIAHCFQRLEPRRVLTVNGAFDAVTGLLQVDITAGGNTNAALRQQDADADRFFLDENADSIFDPLTEVGGLKSDLRELTVRGLGLGSVGVFQWVDAAASNSPVLYNLKSLSILNLESVLFQTRASIESDSSVSASNSIAIESIASGNQLEFDQNLALEVTGMSGQITSGPNANLSVAGVASLTAHVIDVGTQSNDSIHFGTLQFNATGDVRIHADSEMSLVQGSTGDNIELMAMGSVTMQTGSEIVAAGTIEIDATNGDVRITSLRSDGDVSINASGNILDGDDGTDDIDIYSQGNITLTSSDGSIGSNVDSIFLADASPNHTNPLDVSAQGTYEASAVNGLIALNIGDVNGVTVTTSSLWIQSPGNIDVGTIPVSLLAGRDNLALIADVDRNGSGILFLPSELSVVGDLRIQAHDVSAADGTIDLYANRLLFASQQSESIAVLADSIDASTGGSLHLDVSGNPTFEDLNGDALALATLGDLNVQGASGNFLILDPVRSDSGNIIIRTNSSPGDIDQRAKVSSNQGSVTLWASDDLYVRSDVQAGTGTFIQLFADNQSVDGAGMDGVIMVTGTEAFIDQGGVFVIAFNEGDVYLSSIVAEGSEVAVVSEGSILDSNAQSAPPTINVVANRAVLIADNNLDGRGGIGTADLLQLDRNTNRNAIDTQVNELAIQTSDGAYIREVDGVTLISVDDFAPGTGSPTTITTPEGPIKIQSVNGDLVVATQIITQTGDVLLQTLNSGNIVLNQDVISARNVSIDSDDRVLMSSTIRTQEGTVDINALFHVTMEQPAAIETSGGNVRIFSGSIQIGRIDAGDGDVSLTVRSSITDRNGTALNIRADELRLVALTGRLGNLDTFVSNPDTSRAALNLDVNHLAAIAGLGIFVQELNGLTIGDVGEIEVHRVHFNSSTSTVADQALEDLVTSNNGPILVQLLSGDLVLKQGATGNPAIAAHGTGDVLLQTFGSGSIQIEGNVLSNTGNISVRSAGSITQLADIGTVGGSIELNAVGKIAMQSNVTITSGGGNVHVVSASDSIELSLVDAGQGNVYIAANQSIVDNNSASLNVIANQLQLNAITGRIGDSEPQNSNPDANRNALETQVHHIAARSTTGTYIQEQDGLRVGTIDPISVTRPFINGTASQVASPILSGFTTTSEGPIKLQSLTGDITVEQGPNGADAIFADRSADVLLQTINGSLRIEGSVRSGTGHITLVGSNEIDTVSKISTTGGSVLLQASTITMGSSSEVVTSGGNIAVQAVQGSVALGLLDAGTGNVSIAAQGNITDANGTLLNVKSNQLTLRSETGRIGGSDTTNGTPDSNTNAIDTQVTTLAARASTGIYVQESDGVTIDRIDPITVQQVRFNSTQTAVTSSGLEDLTTTNNGPVKLVSTRSNIVVNAGNNQPGVSANGNGDVLLQTMESGTIVVDGDVTSGNGHITIRSAEDFLITDRLVTSAPGSIVIIAGTDVGWASSFETFSTRGVHLHIEAGRDILLREIDAGGGTADVTLIAGRDVRDANDSAFVTVRNVLARSLIVIADSDNNGTGSIGGSDTSNPNRDANTQAIDTQVEYLAARSSQGIYIQESDGITVGPVTVVSERVNFNSTRDVTTTSLEDLATTSTDSSPIKLQTATGNLVILAGVTDALGIKATGASDVMLQTLASGDINIQGDISTSGGDISLKSIDDISISGQIRTSGLGDIYAVSGNSDIDGAASDGIAMSAASQLVSDSGNIMLRAHGSGDVRLGLVETPSGDVAVIADGSILDSNDGSSTAPSLNVIAERLILVADQDGNGVGWIGASNQDRNGNDFATSAIETSVDVLAAKSAQGVFIRELDTLIVGVVPSIPIRESHFNSTTGAISVQGESGLLSMGPVKLLVDRGDLQIDRPIIARDGSEYRDVTIKAFSGAIDEGTSQARIEGDCLTIVAGMYAHLHDVSVTTLRSFTLRNGGLDSSWQTVNMAASDRGDDFVDDLQRIQADQQELLRQQHRFSDVFKEYSLYLVNDREMSVDATIAGDNSQNRPNTSPNIYLETRGDSNLNVNGIVQTNSNNPAEGGIVLVAGNKLNLANGAILETTNNLGSDYDQRINDLELNARFYNASDRPPGVAGLFTTKIVTLAENVGLVTPTPSTRTPATHIFQQVAIQFGNAGESGFESFISYADGYLESFKIAGQEFAQPFTLDGRPIVAEPQGSDSTGLFIRQTPFQDQFLRENTKLPTDAVIRRSADFFLFENAKDPTAIVDLTVASQPIADVISAGPQEGLPMPIVDDVDVPVRIFTHAEAEVVVDPITFIPQAIELTTVVERAADVFLYRVDYDDADEDGEPDQNELPDSEQVLKNLQENQRIPFPGINKPEDTKPSSAQPTQIEIDRIRDALANDPETEVGVYAIIKQTSSGEKIVIEVIPVRDSEAPVPDVEETIRKIELIPVENDGAFLDPRLQIPEYRSSTRLEIADDNIDSSQVSYRTPALGLVLALIGLKRSSANEQRSEQVDEPMHFSRRARTRRRMHRALTQSQQLDPEAGRKS